MIEPTPEVQALLRRLNQLGRPVGLTRFECKDLLAYITSLERQLKDISGAASTALAACQVQFGRVDQRDPMCLATAIEDLRLVGVYEPHGWPDAVAKRDVKRLEQLKAERERDE